jgi:hypothetical protein
MLVIGNDPRSMPSRIVCNEAPALAVDRIATRSKPSGDGTTVLAAPSIKTTGIFAIAVFGISLKTFDQDATPLIIPY